MDRLPRAAITQLFAAATAVAHLGNPAAVALAGLVSAGLLSARYRSLVPGVVVVGGSVGTAVFAKDVMKVVVERPVSQAEIALAAPGSVERRIHFPPDTSRAQPRCLASSRSASVLEAVWPCALFSPAVPRGGASVVALSRLVLDAHWLTDVIGGEHCSPASWLPRCRRAQRHRSDSASNP